MALTNSLLRRFIASKGWCIPKPGETFCFGIRGAEPTDKDSIQLVRNRPDLCNDSIGIAGADWLLVEGSVDPGATFTENPQNPRGVANLADGEHEFGIGRHKDKPALVQVGGTLMWRDGNANYHRDPGEPIHVEHGNGCNIHAGPVGERVGPHSAGCIVIKGGWQGQPWTSYRDTAYEAIRGDRVKREGVIACFLMEGHDLVRYSNG